MENNDKINFFIPTVYAFTLTIKLYNYTNPVNILYKIEPNIYY